MYSQSHELQSSPDKKTTTTTTHKGNELPTLNERLKSWYRLNPHRHHQDRHLLVGGNSLGNERQMAPVPVNVQSQLFLISFSPGNSHVYILSDNGIDNAVYAQGPPVSMQVHSSANLPTRVVGLLVCRAISP